MVKEVRERIALILILVALVAFGASYAIASNGKSLITITSDKTADSEITIGQDNSDGSITIGRGE